LIRSIAQPASLSIICKCGPGETRGIVNFARSFIPFIEPKEKHLQEANLSAQIIQITRAQSIFKELRGASISASNFDEHLMDWDELRLFEASLVELNEDPSSDVTGNKAVLMVISMILHPPCSGCIPPECECECACVCVCVTRSGGEESSGPQDPLAELFNPKVWGTPIRGLAAMDYLAPAFITYPAPYSIIVGVKQIGRMLRHKHFASMINRLDKEQRCVLQSCARN
jgi:hypothetical protein